MVTSVRIHEDTQEKLYQIKAEIEGRDRKYTTLDQVINELIKEYKKRHK